MFYAKKRIKRTSCVLLLNPNPQVKSLSDFSSNIGMADGNANAC